MTNQITNPEDTIRELTDALKKTENQLSESRQELQDIQSHIIHVEKMSTIGQLTAGIAHELNNPINFVSSNTLPLKRDLDDLLSVLTEYAALSEEDTHEQMRQKLKTIQAMKEELELDYVIDELDQLLTGISEGARRTADIVKDLRNFSRIDNDTYRPADIHAGLESSLSLLYNQYKNKVEVIREYQDLPEIECYEGQLNQVWMNLFANAIQAMTNDGVLYIATEMADGQVRVRIRDTGSGMPEEVLSKIFEAFYTTKEVGEGTGLGLSISHGIIEKHHGSIQVDSEIGKGTTFTISLPIKQPETDPRP